MKSLEPSPRKIHFSSLVTRLPGIIPGLLSQESFQALENCIEDRQKNTGFFKFNEYKKDRAKLFGRFQGIFLKGYDNLRGVDRRFGKINIEISNICNLQCTFCPEVIRSKKTMKLDAFEHITKEIAPLTDQVTYHLMGDPLVHSKLDAFLEISARYNTPVFLVTNGTLLDANRSESLLHPILRQVNFSLHSFPDNFPDRDPGTYLARIFEYVDRALLRRPDLYLNFRLWNLESPTRFPEANSRIREHIETHYKVKLPDRVDVRSKKSFRIRDRLYVHYDTEFVWPDPELPLLGETGTCHGLRNHFGILVDGTVVPCCLDKEGRIPLGNILERPILEILESRKAKEILHGFLNRKLVDPLCQRCNYVTRFS
jgi:MoaA/NifB/PqqE/SkfB family radical SAM enzyme